MNANEKVFEFKVDDDFRLDEHGKRKITIVAEFTPGSDGDGTTPAVPDMYEPHTIALHCKRRDATRREDIEGLNYGQPDEEEFLPKYWGGEGYEIPKRVFAYFDCWSDWSYNNDAACDMAVCIEGEWYRMWVQHEDPDKRECGGPRLMLERRIGAKTYRELCDATDTEIEQTWEGERWNDLEEFLRPDVFHEVSQANPELTVLLAQVAEESP